VALLGQPGCMRSEPLSFISIALGEDTSLSEQRQ
jgi:hypothetical protein